MTSIFVLRHPQTTWNQVQRYQGRLDAPLSAQGCLQVDQVSKHFTDARLDAIFSSPLSRASHLADVLARQTGAKMTLDSRLVEMAQGPWEGMYLDDIHRQHGALYEQWYSRPDLARFPGGDTASLVQQRALSVVSDIMVSYPGGAVAVVTHSVVIQTVVCAALSLDLRYLHSIRVNNCGITTLCGTRAPGTVFTLNSAEGLFQSSVDAARAFGCSNWENRRATT